MISEITHKHKVYIIGFIIGFLLLRATLKVFDANYDSLIFDIMPGLVACCYWLRFEYILMREVDEDAGY